VLVIRQFAAPIDFNKGKNDYEINGCLHLFDQHFKIPFVFSRRKILIQVWNKFLLNLI